MAPFYDWKRKITFAISPLKTELGGVAYHLRKIVGPGIACEEGELQVSRRLIPRAVMNSKIT
jgi:hypothetical protein